MSKNLGRLHPIWSIYPYRDTVQKCLIHLKLQIAWWTAAASNTFQLLLADRELLLTETILMAWNCTLKLCVHNRSLWRPNSMSQTSLVTLAQIRSVANVSTCWIKLHYTARYNNSIHPYTGLPTLRRWFSLETLTVFHLVTWSKDLIG